MSAEAVCFACPRWLLMGIIVTQCSSSALTVVLGAGEGALCFTNEVGTVDGCA